MIQNVNEAHFQKTPPLNETASYVGHGGDTYGFMSDNGYFPALNATISVIVNQDSNGLYPSLVACHAVEIVAKHLNYTIKEKFGCRDATVPKYECKTQYGKPTCVDSYRGKETHNMCSATCGKSIVEYLLNGDENYVQ